MTKTWTYVIEFLRKDGCPMGIVEDMARFDAATVTRTSNDLRCAEGHIRKAEFSTTKAAYREPTMARWASFAVGAKQIVKEKV